MNGEETGAIGTRQAQPDRVAFWSAWAAIAAFGTYFCMYGFRKPFTAASFESSAFGGVGFKSILITTQVIGYMLAKLLGVRVVSEISPRRRAVTILVLVLIAHATLVGFGLAPRPWNALFLFGNGLALGMVFGLVLGTLEGRRMTEALAAGLCASFILADGVTKSVGSWLLSQGTPEDWMPAVAGAIFLTPLLVGVAMLAVVPPPTTADVAARSVRAPMTRDDRRALLARHATGLAAIVLVYLLVTVLRSLRADFAPEIWRELGRGAPPSLFTSTELWVAFVVLIINGAATLIIDNRKAFFAALGTCALGAVLLVFALIGLNSGALSDVAFMVLLGLGLYLPYVAIHTTAFERLIAMTGDRANVGFLMYVADAVGYLGYTLVILGRNFGGVSSNLLGALKFASWLTALTMLAALGVAAVYFAGLQPRATAAQVPIPEAAS
jgi:hypothetical protein